MDSNGVSQIIAALGVIHSPSSSNTERRQAQEFLNIVEKEPESPFWGYQLSLPENNDSSSGAIVRHFGLTLLQRSIKHDYDSYDMEKALAVRKWVIELSSKISPSDPVFIKEKLASIWVDIAKRVWGSYLEMESLSKKDGHSNDENTDINKSGGDEEAQIAGWISMDKDLLRLWDLNLATRELSLIIFRTLFEDVYILDDPLATKRSSILTLLCTEVLTPHDILSEYYSRNDALYNSRASADGWVLKWSEFLGQCLESRCADKESANFATRLLATLKTCFHWILPEVLRTADMLRKLSDSLLVDDVRVKILTIDCLHALFTRQYGREEDFAAIVGAVFQQGGINMLLTVYRTIEIDADDINAEEYSLLKKLVEMGVGLSAYLNPVGPSKNATNPYPLPEDADIIGYLRFILETTCHESLIVSGLSLSFWVTVLRMDELSHDGSAFFAVLPNLLEVAADRLVTYEALGLEHVAQKYLAVDFDSQPESMQFLCSYRRFLEDIIRIAVCKMPRDGLAWLENRLSMFFASEAGATALCNKRFRYTNGADEAYLLCMSQFAIIEACIKGVTRWKLWYTAADKDAKLRELNALVDTLFQQLLRVQLNDPVLCRKQMQTLVQFCPLVKTSSSQVFSLLEKILGNATHEFPADVSDDDAEVIRDLRSSAGTELNRLAYMAPEVLGERFDDLQTAVDTLLKSKKVSVHESVAFKLFLLLVSQRSDRSGADVVDAVGAVGAAEERKRRFAAIVDSDLGAWSDPATMKGLSDLHWFMERLGIVQIAAYFRTRGITADTDLLATQMDAEGRRLKTELKSHWEAVFPIRATRIYLQYSIEKLAPSSPEFQELLALWKPRVLPILPRILQLIAQIRAYHNPHKWSDLPAEVQAFVRHSCAERFWQIGVSTQTRDTFLEESVKATHSLRDFADSVGHIIKYTREYAFLTIGSISSLGLLLYEIPSMPEILWDAVAGDVTGVSLYSWKHMIHVLFRPVVKNCPAEYVDTFLKDILILALPTIDALLVSKWEKIISNGIQLESASETPGSVSDDALSEEMMEEHLLRQLTAVVVRFLIDLVGQFSSRSPSSSSASTSKTQAKTRNMIFNTLPLLESLLQLLVHIISFKDTKCTYNAILILRGILKDILLKDENLDKWLCSAVFPVLYNMLLDNYFQDAHSEAGYLLCEIYITLRTKSTNPRLLLQELSGVSDKTISNMEKMIMTSRSLRQQKNCIIHMITSKQNEQFQEEQRKRAISRVKKKQETDIINQSLQEDDGEGLLNNLFG